MLVIHQWWKIFLHFTLSINWWTPLMVLPAGYPKNVIAEYWQSWDTNPDTPWPWLLFLKNSQKSWIDFGYRAPFFMLAIFMDRIFRCSCGKKGLQFMALPVWDRRHPLSLESGVKWLKLGSASLNLKTSFLAGKNRSGVDFFNGLFH